MKWLLRFVHFYVIMTVYAQEASITIPPRPVNVSLYEVAEFTCTGSADAFIWELNKEQIGNEMGIVISTTLVNEADNIRMSVLRITVSSSDVSKNITCTSFSLNPISTVESKPAILMVQGLLGSVHDLTATLINSTTVLISWSPPLTLKGVPILGYNVTISTDTNNKKNETILVEGDTTMLYWSINSTTSSLYFVVVPINQVGAGQFADFTFTGSLTSSVIVISPSSTQSTMTHSTNINIGTMISKEASTSLNTYATPLPTSSLMPRPAVQEIDVVIVTIIVIIITTICVISSIIIMIIISIFCLKKPLCKARKRIGSYYMIL